MRADDTWFSGLRGMEIPEPLNPTDFDDREAIRAHWDKVEQAMRSYLDELRDEKLTDKPFPEGEDEDLILCRELAHPHLILPFALPVGCPEAVDAHEQRSEQHADNENQDQDLAPPDRKHRAAGQRGQQQGHQGEQAVLVAGMEAHELIIPGSTQLLIIDKN
jgi:hypothetical protein